MVIEWTCNRHFSHLQAIVRTVGMTRELTACKNHRWMSWYVFSVFAVCYSASCLVNKTAPAAVASNGHMQVAFSNIVYNLVALLRDIQAEEVRMWSLTHADMSVGKTIAQCWLFVLLLAHYSSRASPSASPPLDPLSACSPSLGTRPQCLFSCSVLPCATDSQDCAVAVPVLAHCPGLASTGG